MSGRQPEARSIGEFLVSARDADEYQAMFDLTDGDLTGRVLDCPGGGASFTATACARGVDAVAVDRVYGARPAALIAQLDAELARGAAWTRATAERYAWGFYGDPAAHARRRRESAGVFAADLLAHPERYVPASLPHLPFPDGSFDLVLSSHLLFTYADRLDHDWHRAALQEMVRVSRGRVRVFPLVDQAGGRLTGLVEHLVSEVSAAGIAAVLRPVPFEFQQGAREMLELDVSQRC
ncbi:methyltransferase domain-containing protein [Modestobacter sp. VKM Ac-2983]|uniref:class I SAM-dependent methyltransferase n=1 Tax=Modestobacter sp. VKM Ac-2983 TaxID=3004137 RepID=UPI0022AB6725|nr:methyltransferase domain-containing protein [Modestobacter sp. VKM Ac-2983]MCZ2804394.1 methyltransferase domain-containing protein [Modestobacter sp. VKM Ac-2983]